MKTIHAYWIALRIEYHWRRILHYRKAGSRLLDAGEPLTSERLIALTKKIDHHGTIALRLENQYEAVTGSAL